MVSGGGGRGLEGMVGGDERAWWEGMGGHGGRGGRR